MANKISELTVAYHGKAVGFLRYLNDRTFFAYDENKKSYVLASAYDLTRTINQKEHETSCNGTGLSTEKDLIEVAIKVGIPTEKAKNIISFVKNVVESRLGEWLRK